MRLWDGTNGDDVSEYLRVNQLEMLEKIKGEDRRSRDITLLPIMPQFRTTRRIDGNYTLRVEDAYRHFDDSIAAICDFWSGGISFMKSPTAPWFGMGMTIPSPPAFRRW